MLALADGARATMEELLQAGGETSTVTRDASPKAVVRASVAVGLMSEEDGRLALKMADDRNQTSHTYNDALAQQIFSALPGHARIMQVWLEAMNARLDCARDR